MGLVLSIKYLSHHKLVKKERFRAFGRYVRFNIATRILNVPVILDYVEGTQLLVQRGMASGATNYYVYLEDYAEMMFLLHYLTEDDAFVDVGANIGAYSLLAGSVIGAHTIAFEPCPESFEYLRRNVCINPRNNRYELYPYAVGDKDKQATITTKLGIANRVVENQGEDTVNIQMRCLDNVCVSLEPALLKIDTEGYEKKVLYGAEKTLKKNSLKAIIIELNGGGNKYGCSDEQTHLFLSQYGFKPATYDPEKRSLVVNTTWNKEGRNTIYVRSVEEVRKRVSSARAFLIGNRRL